MVPELTELGNAPTGAGANSADKGKSEPASLPKRAPGPAPLPKAAAPAKTSEPPSGPAAGQKAPEKSEATKVVSIDAFRKK